MSAAAVSCFAGATPTLQAPLKASEGALATWPNIVKTLEETVIKALTAPSSLPVEVWETVGAILAALATYETLSRRTAG
jgi:hypothetical protein